ncbi:MAG: hypothetical protein Q8N23_23125 [Archangium sp.]|nr:hypothetical protein [Archangium sp.]MDP3570811.1 hypothetical protein [Archangium sp.]
MVDYRKFLGKADTLIAPWFGGPSIDAPGRRLKLSLPPPRPGWYRFELKGRIATAKEAADPPDVSSLPKVRGFLWRDRLVTDNAKAEPLHLLPEEEPARFSPITARRWHGATLLFDALDFESEAEGAVREALATGAALHALKSIPAPLRAAYGFALAEQTARRLAVPVAAAEIRAHVGRIADGGVAQAEAVIRDLIAERAQTEREMAELRARLTAAQLRAELEHARQQRIQERQNRRETPEDRVWQALEKAGARFESSRHVRADQLEVVFGFMGERFISLVDEDTLQVLDSGICLGHPPADKLITLDSLPAVIKEAIETDRLVILRAP